MLTAKQVADEVLANHPCIDESLNLGFGDFKLQVKSNNQQLINEMRGYFEAFLISHNETDAKTIYVFESEMSQPDVEFKDWQRDPGKAGRKDAYVDTPDGRLCWKVRTGMNYVLSNEFRIAYGPALANISQAINFTLNQHLEWIMNQGGLICHAAAVAHKGSGIAISAFSGGGKSTTALHLMNLGLDFVSNDRLFIQAKDSQPIMTGIAKQPRINPGTILNNETLVSILPEERAAELKLMPKEELWQLEEKYDAMIDDLYGKGRFKLQTKIHAHVILNWKHDSTEPTQLKKVDIQQREDLLAAIMKSPGPFYVDKDGIGWANGRDVDKQQYLDTLSHIDVYEISGKIDFDKVLQPLLSLVKQD